ncbi:hypothetical protein [Nostoc sp.]
MAIITGCNGAKRPLQAIALKSIHNKVSQKIDSKLILGDCIPYLK